MDRCENGEFSGTGIVIGDLGFAAARSSHRRDHVQVVTSSPKSPPISVLLPRISGEPLRLECGFPTHPRGSGMFWPPESRVDADRGAGRFPLAAAWSKLATDDPWRWHVDETTVEVRPREAIAAGLAAVLGRHPSKGGSSVTAFVIPNGTREREQQALIDASHTLGVSPVLLWRPVAAALAWEHKLHDALMATLLQTGSAQDDAIGSLVCLHVGLSEIELTVLELRVIRQDGQVWIVPARRRSDAAKQVTASFGWKTLTDRAKMELEELCLPSGSSQAWQLLFASNWAQTALEGRQDNEPNMVELAGGDRFVPTREPLRMQDDGSSFPSYYRWAFLGDWKIHQNDWQSLCRWCYQRQQDISDSIVGAVVTGEFARILAPSGESLGRELLHRLGVRSGRALIDPLAAGDRLLATGASLFAVRLAAGEPTFLDTLPQLQLLVRRQGEMHWEELLDHRSATVEGGKVWKRPEPVNGLAIPRGSPILKFAVFHEEYPGVRELEVDLPRICEEEEPASLLVEITPAQGAARLEVLPDRQHLFERRRLFVDWKRMIEVKDDRGNPYGPAEYIESQPRIYPELLPRLHSPAKWQAVVDRIHRPLVGGRSIELGRLGSLVVSLRDKDPDAYPRDATPVSSEGDVDHQREVLNQLVDELWSRLQRTRRNPDKRIIRCLGYTSTDHEQFADFLVSHIRSETEPGQAILLAAGHCLRRPDHIAELAEGIHRHFTSQTGGSRLDWLKSLSEVLQYRKEATREIESRMAEHLLRICLRQFQDQLANHKAMYIFRHAALSIVFLLRRRAYDNSFLDPESVLAQEIKATFSQAIDEARRGALQVLGGAVDIRAAIQQMIDYIDRRGVGAILLASDTT